MLAGVKMRLLPSDDLMHPLEEAVNFNESAYYNFHDAGCGLGHGLQALRQAYPLAQLHGLEWSWPLTLLCRWRCKWADVQRGDIWRGDWSRYDLVYLFQRPESMPRAVEKARTELKPGAWLVSLEFEAAGLTPVAKLDGTHGKPVWVYRAPLL